MSSIVLDALIKINLALHVIGQRLDGYHLLQTVVAFSPGGDKIEVWPFAQDAVYVNGEYGQGLGSAKDNLIVKARDILRAQLGENAFPVCLNLNKNLPLASGLGGGSCDAAATLLALGKIWQIDRSKIDLYDLGLRIGADVPMCLYALEYQKTLLVAGIGEEITPLPIFPALDLVLINPKRELSTREVFKQLVEKNNPSFILGDEPLWNLKSLRNDLTLPACQLMPEISQILQILKQSGAVLARMSGSGASCFGIYETQSQAEQVADTIAKRNPDYFVRALHTFG